MFASTNQVFVGVVKTRRPQGHDKTKFGKVGKKFTDSDFSRLLKWDSQRLVATTILG